MTRDLAEFKSEWIHRAQLDEPLVAEIVVRDCSHKIGLTAKEIAGARVINHGDYSKSTVLVSVELAIDCEGKVDELEKYFVRCLANTLEAQRSKLSRQSDEIVELRAKVARLESDARAAAVVQSSLIAAGASSK